MKISKYILAIMAAGVLTACSDDKLGDSIFPDNEEQLDPESYTYKFDKWLNDNFRNIYNVDFKYKMEDVETDLQYNLVPATYEKARDLAALTKYLWFDTYKEIWGGPEFLMQHGPRILHLIGTPAYNPNTGTEMLGLAEGGIKVSLFKVNSLDPENINQLNEFYFRTMHHEFAHILHQKKSYPTEFNLLSTGRYDSGTWSSKPIGLMASQGFITPYASAEPREDFAETVANYLTRIPSQYELILWMAERGWSNGADNNNFGSPDDAEYGCYYYIPDAARPDDRRFVLSSVEKDDETLVAIKGVNGEYMHTVQEVEEYIARLNEKVPGGLIAVEDKDNINGRDIILQKQKIARSWFKSAWGIDLKVLHDIVQTRQNNFDIDALRAEIENVQ